MSIDGPGVLLRLGIGELEPLDFTEENFPVGAFVMGGSGKLVRVESWTSVVPVVDGEMKGEPVPTALVTLWGDNWYDSYDAPPSDVGKSTTLKQTSFGAPAGKGWPITYPLVSVSIPEETAPAPATVTVPDLFMVDDGEDVGSESRMDLPAVNEPVSVPDAFVAPAPVTEPDPIPEPVVMSVGADRSGPHPSNRSKVGRLYNMVLEAGGVVKMADAVAWANTNKLEKDGVTDETIKKLIAELAKDDWPISLLGEGTEFELVSIGGVTSVGAAPSRLDNIAAAAQTCAIKLYEMGVSNVEICVNVKPGLAIVVSEGDE